MHAAALLLSYQRMTLPQKGERGQMPPQNLLCCGHAPNRHERIGVWRVTLDDRNEGHARGAQAVRDGSQRRLIGNDETDRVRAAQQIAGAALAGRVDDVRGLDSSWEVRPHNHVVKGEGVRRPYGAIARSS